jgi:hypothetical protein
LRATRDRGQERNSRHNPKPKKTVNSIGSGYFFTAMIADGISFILLTTMEKIKNGDPVLYKNRKGTIYGKPRENKYKGLLYTVKIGDDYVKASANELTPTSQEVAATSGLHF